MNGPAKVLRCLLVTCLLSMPLLLKAQSTAKTCVLQVNPLLHGKPAEHGMLIGKVNGDSIAIHTFQFYLGNFTLLKNGKTVWQAKNRYSLLDINDAGTCTITLKTGVAFDALAFDLGTDSLTNVSGAMGGDLDPTKGMYWAWNSGYVNFKLEGYAEKCPTRNHQFEFHIGGYMPPFQTVQPIEFSDLKTGNIQVDIELSGFFEHMDLAKTHTVMSPSETSAKLAQLLAKTFRVHGN